MRFAMLRHEGPALVVEKTAIPLPAAAGWPRSLEELIAGAAAARQRIEAWLPSAAARAAARPLSEVAFDAPLHPERFVFTIGENYAGAGEATQPSRDAPLIFGKLGSSVVGPDAELSWDPALLPLVDYEVELAVIIGARVRNCAPEEALDHVFGYTCLNDIASREQRYDGDQWLLGKSHPSFCPIGPWIVTADDVPDPYALPMRSILNGEVVQSGSSAQMRFRIPEIISYLSRFMELAPGDVIATGTPPVTGIGRQPPRLLEDGDEITIEIDGIGSLRNRVVLRP
jgi:2-keto-4-pentenoate hydratase/2-oxohepta-3-ene-1,7-dioic acid hydratase in catechol pathway